ncbi:MAG: hypothetical protein WD770_03170 [Actinomycetota bacterium]
MTQPPPPPPMTPPPGPPPPGPAGARPPLVSGAAIVLFVIAGLQVIAGLWLLSFGGIFAVYAILALALAAAGIYAGIQIMAGNETGRLVGLGVAGVGIILQLLSIGNTTVTAVIILLMYIFVIYVLVQNAAYFRKT